MAYLHRIKQSDWSIAHVIIPGIPPLRMLPLKISLPTGGEKDDRRERKNALDLVSIEPLSLCSQAWRLHYLANTKSLTDAAIWYTRSLATCSMAVILCSMK